MAALLLTDGADYLLKFQLGKSISGSMKLRLYTNDHAPALADSPANYTQCVLAGYAAVDLVGTNWTGSSALGVATYAYPSVTFTFAPYVGAVATVYGYYVTNPGGTIAVWAERFTTPAPIQNAGGNLILSLTWVDRQ